jgi:FO synthase
VPREETGRISVTETKKRLVTAPGELPLVERVAGRSGATLGALAIARKRGVKPITRPDQPTPGPRFDGSSPADELESRLAQCSPESRSILERSLEGEELGFEDLVHLLGVEGPDFLALQAVADHWRRSIVGDVVTYVVNRNINFTNVCTIGCGFCAFSTGMAMEDAYFLSVDQVVERARECWDRGGTEVCIQGGIHPTMDWKYYPQLLEAIKSELPLMHTHAFSPMEIVWGSKNAGLGFREYLELLKEAGLDTIPGTAAEILDDGVRQVLSPKKESVAEWVEVVETAHSLGIRSTATIMFGHIETVEQRARHLMLIRDIQKETGGFTEFVPLPFVHQYAPIYIQGKCGPGPTRLDAVRMHAVSRLAFVGWIDNVQASWVKLGVRGVQECLQSGCNDFGGTLMEESISRLAGASNGQELWVDQIAAAIREIGRIPKQRSTTYGDPPRDPIPV